MSGVSLAVDRHEDVSQRFSNRTSWARRLIGSVGTIELQFFAFIFVFAASGLVPLPDIMFTVFVPSYLYILAKKVFPSLQKEGGKMEIFHGSRNFQLYMMFGTAVGLFLPLAYVLGGFARGDQRAVIACTPALFLLSNQMLLENIVHKLAIWSPPVRAFLVAIYTARQIFSIVDWVNATASSYNLDSTVQDIAWIGFGHGLAIANLIYYNVNMFCFVIPRFIPRAFQRYYEAKAAVSSNPASSSMPSTSNTVTNDPPKKRK